MLEPGRRLQQKSRSSLLRRIPVRGEYTIAPKLQWGWWGREAVYGLAPVLRVGEGALPPLTLTLTLGPLLKRRSPPRHLPVPPTHTFLGKAAPSLCPRMLHSRRGDGEVVSQAKDKGRCCPQGQAGVQATGKQSRQGRGGRRPHPLCPRTAC